MSHAFFTWRPPWLLTWKQEQCPVLNLMQDPESHLAEKHQVSNKRSGLGVSDAQLLQSWECRCGIPRWTEKPIFKSKKLVLIYSCHWPCYEAKLLSSLSETERCFQWTHLRTLGQGTSKEKRSIGTPECLQMQGWDPEAFTAWGTSEEGSLTPSSAGTPSIVSTHAPQFLSF